MTKFTEYELKVLETALLVWIEYYYKVGSLSYEEKVKIYDKLVKFRKENSK